MHKFFTLIFLLIFTSLLHAAPQNILRNGGFEGSKSFWMPRKVKTELVKADDAKQGEYFLRKKDKGFIHSEPVLLERKKTYTFAFWARNPKGGKKVWMTIHPTPRMAGEKPFCIGRGKGEVKGVLKKVNPPLTNQWQRYVFTATLPDFGRTVKHPFNSPWWWDGKSWWVVFGGDPGLEIDGMTLVEGKKDPGWVPARPVEVAVHINNLPGYTKQGNMYNVGDTAEAQAAIFNPTDKEQEYQVKWAKSDYRGKNTMILGKKVITIPAEKTVMLDEKIKLNQRGLILIQAIVSDAKGKELARTHAPVTTLPFPKKATKPDVNERFGGTFVAGQPNPTHMMPTAQAIGLRWTRWYPSTKWHLVQPKSAKEFKFPDELVKYCRDHGMGVNFVMHGWPKWAVDKKKHRNLPFDMRWKADDKRWQDLSIETSWDKYIKTMVKRYPGPDFAWEISNEPQFDRWDAAEYYQFIVRTSKIIKQIDPKAVVMINSVNGFDGISKDFARRGGGEYIDVFTFHNYGSNYFAGKDSIKSMDRAYRRKDGSTPEIWFNEGWTWPASSRDGGCPGMRSDRPADWVGNMFVRAHAETMAAGMDKMIYFNMSYNSHGRSWWDWGGDGTEMWDDHNEPTTVVPALNVLIDQIGLSDQHGWVEHKEALLHTFEDKRNNRGVIIAWGTKDNVKLEIPIGGLQAMDIMGNPVKVKAGAKKTVVDFEEKERPLYLFKKGLHGPEIAKALKPLQRPDMEGGEGVYTVPRKWMDLEDKGNPFKFKGKKLWEFARLLPEKPDDKDAYIRMNKWNPARSMWTHDSHTHGGQPLGHVNGKGETILAARSSSGGKNGPKSPVLIFYAPEDGTYELTTQAEYWSWEGSGTGELYINLLNSEQGEVQELAAFKFKKKDKKDIKVEAIELREGQPLAILFRITDKMYTGGNMKMQNLKIQKK